jgi:hypothetical protein
MLSLRQMIAHCPPASAARHFSRLGIAREQFADDAKVVLGLGSETMRQAGSGAKFAGRVATGMGRRMIARMVGAKPAAPPRQGGSMPEGRPGAAGQRKRSEAAP